MDLIPHRILLVSNRLPVTVRNIDGEMRVEMSVGGLATGLRSIRSRGDNLWLGWPGDLSSLPPDQLEKAMRKLRELDAAPVELPGQLVKGFYEGFSNGILWPLFHYLLDQVKIDASEDWGAYVEANVRFADAIEREYRDGDLVWIHDYQLLLLPSILRDRLPGARIGFFLHIPFPSSEMFRILPHREEILQGMLGADLIGFHTHTYLRHFQSNLLRILGIEAEVDHVRYGSRDVRLGVFPMGIDAGIFGGRGESAEVAAEVARLRAECSGQKILLGVDRLDYTKGLRRRILAIERLLEKRPDLAGKIRLIQAVVPSREGVGAYEQLRRSVDELIGRVNGRFSTASWAPVQYLYRSLTAVDLSAFYRAADVMLVTPLRDGMNLVAKEYCATRTDDDGVLVISEFAGAASELGQALVTNPFDVDRTADVIILALEMPGEEKAFRMRALRQRVGEYSVQRWFEDFISVLSRKDTAVNLKLARPATPREVLGKLVPGAPLVLLLDYDGTLVPFADLPDTAVPDRPLLQLLGNLASRKDMAVHIVSGRKREFLDRWMGGLGLGLHAEHGFCSREPGQDEWDCSLEASGDWKGRVRRILEEFCSQTPGTLIEEKTTSLVWHYRMADAEFGSMQARELRLHLAEVLANEQVSVLTGSKIVEIRRQGIHKGLAVARALRNVPTGCQTIAIGDDITDEDLFAGLPPGSISIHVGKRPSIAGFRFSRISEVRELLKLLAER